MNERIKKLWEDSTGNCWPRPSKFSAGETDDGLARFVKAVTAEHIAALVEDRESFSDQKANDLWDAGFDAGIARAERVLKDKFLVDKTVG